MGSGSGVGSEQGACKLELGFYSKYNGKSSEHFRFFSTFNKNWVILSFYLSELPRWLSGKESACQYRGHRLNRWVRKIPWSRKWQPTPVFLPGKSQGQRSLVGYHPWGHKRVGHDFSNKTTNLSESIWPMVLAAVWRAAFGRIRDNEKPQPPPVLAPLLCCLSSQSSLPHDDREVGVKPQFSMGIWFLYPSTKLSTVWGM